MASVFDTGMMARAIRLARRGLYSTRPNPTVGCVLTRDEAIIGEGFTRPWGQPHAEVVALESCQQPAGATAYVTLEPCGHSDKTGPCAEALIDAGVSRVVMAMRDPNPRGTGGLEKLRAAAIETEVGVLQAEAGAINRGFYQRMRHGKPFVRIKLAMSLDGRTAMSSGESRWITGAAARADVQRLRARSDAIITGVGTVLADNPALTVRDAALDIQFQPLRVIVDSHQRTPADARILNQPGSVLMVTAASGAPAIVTPGTLIPAVAEARNPRPGGAGLHPAANGHKLEILSLPGLDGRVDLAALVTELGGRQVNDILVECGPRLAGALVEAGLAEELVVYMAPTLMGSGARPLLDLPIARMGDKRALAITDMRRVGDDWRVTCSLAS